MKQPTYEKMNCFVLSIHIYVFCVYELLWGLTSGRRVTEVMRLVQMFKHTFMDKLPHNVFNLG